MCRFPHEALAKGARASAGGLDVAENAQKPDRSIASLLTLPMSLHELLKRPAQYPRLRPIQLSAAPIEFGAQVVRRQTCSICMRRDVSVNVIVSVMMPSPFTAANPARHPQAIFSRMISVIRS